MKNKIDILSDMKVQFSDDPLATHLCLYSAYYTFTQISQSLFYHRISS